MNSIDNKIKERIKNIIDIKSKIKDSNEKITKGDVNPLFLALFGKKLTLQTKIGQSLQTTLGMSFNEQLCKIIAENYGYEVQLQYKLKGFISADVSHYLENLLEDDAYLPNRLEELKNLKSKVEEGSTGEAQYYPDSTVDIFLKKDSGEEICIDITSPKPNKKEIRTMKRKLLKWTAMRWSQNLNANVESYLGVTYSLEKGLGGDNYMHKKWFDREDILVGDELFKLLSNGEYSVAKIEAILTDIGQEFQEELNNSELLSSTD